MHDGKDLRRDFLSQTAWCKAELTPLRQDASPRQYFRLASRSAGPAILMHARGTSAKDVANFIDIGDFLRRHGCSAPKIYAQDLENRLLLLEDFGDLRFCDQPSDQSMLFRLAADTLVHLQSTPCPKTLPMCDTAHLAELATTAWDWYAPRDAQSKAPSGAQVAACIFELAQKVDLAPRTLILRDFHSENLMYLPARIGIARAGLLDFQDAMCGHPAFDLMSLLQDARHDIDQDLAQDVIAYYCHATQTDPSQFAASFAALGAIRQLRILGVFARLSLNEQRAQYLNFLPRVWAHLIQNLAHPALANLRELTLNSLPEPDPVHLKYLAGS